MVALVGNLAACHPVSCHDGFQTGGLLSGDHVHPGVHGTRHALPGSPSGHDHGPDRDLFRDLGPCRVPDLCLYPDLDPVDQTAYLA